MPDTLPGVNTAPDANAGASDLDRVLDRLRGVQKHGKGHRALCPAHLDKTPSLDIDVKNGKVLLICRSQGCKYEDIIAAANLAPSIPYTPVDRPENVKREITRRDVYHNADGSIFGRVDRLEPGFGGASKSCLPYLYDHEKQAYNTTSSAGGKTFPLFNLPAVMACASPGGTVVIPEGEKCAEAVATVLQAQEGVCVTTLQGGGEKRFHTEHLAALHGAGWVIILADSDGPGRKTATAHSERIKRAYPNTPVHTVDFFPGDNPGNADPKRDVADWLRLNGGKDAGALWKYIDAHGVAFVSIPSPSPLAKLAALTGTYEGPEEIDEIALADVQPENYEYIWDARIPKGILTLLCGDPGNGKSFVSLALAAAISKGALLPGNEKAIPVGYTSIWNAEDSISKTTRRRADKLDADHSRIIMLRGVKDKNGKLRPLTIDDISIIESNLAKAVANGCPRSMLVIDPLLSLIGAKADTHRISEVTAVLTPLAQLAETFNLAILGIMHHRKSAAATMLNLINGSTGFGAAARSVLFTVEHPTSKRRSIVTVKSTNDEKPPPIEYGIYGKADMDDGKVPGTFWWGNPDVTLNGEHLLEGHKPPRPARTTEKLDDAKAFLARELAEGPRTSSEISKRALDAGIRRDTLYKAQTDLSIKPEIVKNEKGRIVGSTWALPSEVPNAAALVNKALDELRG